MTQFSPLNVRYRRVLPLSPQSSASSATTMYILSQKSKPLQDFCTKQYGNAEGYEKSRFSADISLYLGNDIRQSHIQYNTIHKIFIECDYTELSRGANKT